MFNSGDSPGAASVWLRENIQPQEETKAWTWWETVPEGTFNLEKYILKAPKKKPLIDWLDYVLDVTDVEYIMTIFPYIKPLLEYIITK